MVPAALQSLIEDVVRTKLAPTAITSVESAEGKNAFDDDALFVTVHLPAATDAVPGERMLAAMAVVSDAVLNVGDSRFPHLMTLRAGEAGSDEQLELHH